MIALTSLVVVSFVEALCALNSLLKLPGNRHLLLTLCKLKR